MMQQLIGSVLAVLATVLLLACVGLYHWSTRGHWRDDEMGWHLMCFMGALAATFSLATIRFVAVDVLGHVSPGWFGWLRLVVFAAIPAVALWRLSLIVRAQRQPKPEPKEQL